MKKIIMFIAIMTVAQSLSAPIGSYNDSCNGSFKKTEEEYVLIGGGLEIDELYLAEWGEKQLKKQSLVDAKQKSVENIEVKEKQETRCKSPLQKVAAVARVVSPVTENTLKSFLKVLYKVQ